jgi:hypothetical protein
MIKQRKKHDCICSGHPRGRPKIGTAYLAEKWSDEGVHQGHQDYISIVRIEPQYKRQGIAIALYRTIEKHIGAPLRPSPTDQSDEAKAFWAGRTAR